MLVVACLKHWYTSLIFFGPVPIVGLWVWLSGRRKMQEESSSAPGPPGPGTAPHH